MEYPQSYTMISPRGLDQPFNCSTPDVLDLCVRKRRRSPSPEGAYHQLPPKPQIYADPPTPVMCFSSPGSQAGSETSDPSMCCDSYSAYPATQETPIIQKAKIPRPFKAYPKNPLTIAVATAETILGKPDAYEEFRTRMLSQVQSQNSGTNIKMRRTTMPSAAAANGDPNYWEKRRKNNEAAKRSRDARRAKEDEIAIRCAYLEQENLKLKYDVMALRKENQHFRSILYQ